MARMRTPNCALFLFNKNELHFPLSCQDIYQSWTEIDEFVINFMIALSSKSNDAVVQCPQRCRRRAHSQALRCEKDGAMIPTLKMARHNVERLFKCIKGREAKTLSAEIVEFASGDEENAAAKSPSDVVTVQPTTLFENTLGAVCSFNVGIQAGAITTQRLLMMKRVLI